MPALYRRWNHLGQAVGFGVRHFEYAGHIADGRTGRHLAKRHDVGDTGVAILAGAILDDLAAPGILDIDVDVGHRDAIGVQETFEQQVVFQRVQVGDIERIGDDGACRRTSARPEDDTLALAPVDEILDDEEITVVAHLLEHAELHIETLQLGFVEQCPYLIVR